MITDSIGNNDDNSVVVHMFPGGSKSYLKEWDNDKWIELISFLINNNFKVFLTGSAQDKERAFEIYNKLVKKDNVIVIAGKYDIKQTTDLINSSKLVISVNTGIMHIASAVLSNLIAIHGPTSIKRWGPLNDNSINITSPLSCAPCLNLGFEYACNENRCMQEISVEIVIDTVKKYIN